MKPSTRYFLRNISRLFYTGGTILLLVGMLLSMVNQPVKADAPGPVSKDLRPGSGASVPQPTQESVSDKPAQDPITVNVPRREPAQSSQNQPNKVVPPMNIPAVLPPGTTISFDDEDYSICVYVPIPITVTGSYFIPEDPNDPGRQYELQTSYYIVNPDDLSTDIFYFPSVTIDDGAGSFSVTGLWPGIRPGDTVVEIHFGANLRDPSDGTVLSIGAGLDVYWYPYVCSPPTLTFTPTATATATNTATATATATNTATATFTATATATNTATATSTATATATSTATATATSTATGTNTATATSTGTITATFTSTPTATATSTVPTPPGGGGTNTPTPPSRITPPTPTDPSNTDPTATPDGGVIIPDTGADLPGFGGLAGMMINLGLLFLGIGLILTGLSRPRTTH